MVHASLGFNRETVIGELILRPSPTMAAVFLPGSPLQLSARRPHLLYIMLGHPESCNHSP